MSSDERVAKAKAALVAAHEAMRLRRERGETIERLDPLERARRNPTNQRLAIRAKCWDCSGASRQAVRLCPSTRCPLHALRPWQRSTSDDDASTDDDTEESA